MGAKVHLGWPVRGVVQPWRGSELRIYRAGGEDIDRVACNLYMPCTGNSPSSCILQSELFESQTGLARVDDYLRIEGTEDIWAAGDISNAEPALCVNAVRQGFWVAKNLDRVLRNKEPKAYHRNKPCMYTHPLMIQAPPSDRVSATVNSILISRLIAKITISLGREKVECPKYDSRTFVGACSNVYSKVCAKLFGMHTDIYPMHA
jgi:hypothetical protein